MTWQSEVERGSRFAFGANWARFLSVLDENRVGQAIASLKAMLAVTDLTGKRFLDVGSGSGLFSLAARRLGASVVSFDYDPQAVACTQSLRECFYPSDCSWDIMRGSALDRDFLQKLGHFDVVYAWGALHHTGNQWQALDNVMRSAVPGGTLFLALYNDQGWLSRYWIAVKKIYNRLPVMRPLILSFYAPYYVGLRWIVRMLRGRVRQDRGMAFWFDLIDWLGGWPFEVSTPRQVIDFSGARGFRLLHMTTAGRRHGCNEFVLRHDGG